MGTGLGAAPGFAQAVIARLRADTGLPLVQAPNLFEALAARDGLVELSAALRGAAVSLTKIANDLRWLASGPRCGLGELRLPELQPGSSIMPGKVNPVMSEMLLMVCAQVVGNDATVAWAGAAGNFELNAMIPVIAVNVLSSIELLARAARLFADRCVAGLNADAERCAALVEQSLALATALVPRLGTTPRRRWPANRWPPARPCASWSRKEADARRRARAPAGPTRHDRAPAIDTAG